MVTAVSTPKWVKEVYRSSARVRHISSYVSARSSGSSTTSIPYRAESSSSSSSGSEMPVRLQHAPTFAELWITLQKLWGLNVPERPMAGR